MRAARIGNKGARSWLVVLCIAAPVACTANVAADTAANTSRIAPAPHPSAIASAHPLATRAGQEILASGGNAFDAAVAVSAALGVVEPNGSGLGGGGFYLVHQAISDTDTMIDVRERAPAAATRDMYLDAHGNPIPEASTRGPLAAAIPGEAAGFEYLAQHFGRLPLAKSLQPAIRLARDGFPMYERLRQTLQAKIDVLRLGKRAEGSFLSHGEVLPVGALVRQANLAHTLEAIAARGAAGFYQGSIGKELVEAVRAGGGIWSAADLASYRAIERKPVSGKYRDAKIVSGSPPTSGGVALIDALNILATQDLAGADGATRKHLIIEAMQRAYQDRASYLGDPDFVAVPVPMLISPIYAAGQAASIRRDKAMPSANLPGVASPPNPPSTTHFCILDREGNLVAGTLSLNLWLGTGYLAGKTGVLLNNTMDDFSIKPNTPNEYGLVGGEANSIAGGKRSLSSMTPSFIRTPKGLMIIGSPGGSFITTMVILGTLNYLDGMSAGEIVSAPRFHHQFLPDVVKYEPNAFSAEEIERLTAQGHHLDSSERQWGNMQVITWDFASGKVEAASDPRGVGEGATR